MAALTEYSWTLRITRAISLGGSQEYGSPHDGSLGRRHTVQLEGEISLAGTDTYPDGGIPLPPIGDFGFRREMRWIVLFAIDAAAGTVAEYVTRYDATNHKLFLYGEEASAAGGPLPEVGTSEVPGPRTWQFIAQGW